MLRKLAAFLSVSMLTLSIPHLYCTIYATLAPSYRNKTTLKYQRVTRCGLFNWVLHVLFSLRVILFYCTFCSIVAWQIDCDMYDVNFDKFNLLLSCEKAIDKLSPLGSLPLRWVTLLPVLTRTKKITFQRTSWQPFVVTKKNGGHVFAPN